MSLSQQNLKCTMKKFISTLLLGIGFAGVATAQDPNFSQFFSSPLTLNPALTGKFDGSYRIALSPTGARLTRHVFGNTPPEAMDDVATVNGSPPMALPEEFSSLDQPFTPLLDDRIDVLILYTPTVTQTVGSANVQSAS